MTPLMYAMQMPFDGSLLSSLGINWMAWTDGILRGQVALVDLTIRATAVLTVGCVVSLVLRRSSAANRHWLWVLVISSLLILPALLLIMPTWPVPIWKQAVGRLEDAHQTPSRPVMAEPKGTDTCPFVQMDQGGMAPSRHSDPGKGRAREVAVPSATEKRPVGPTPRAADIPDAGGPTNDANGAGPLPSDSYTSRFGDWQTWLVLVWSTGVVIAATSLSISLLLARRVIRQSKPIQERQRLRLLHDLATRLGVRRHVALRLSSRSLSPMTWGLLRPVIVLPPGSRGWTDELWHAVLLHELAHIKRLDWFTSLLGRVAGALFWFHPLMWIALRRLRADADRAADDITVGTGIESVRYAELLVGLARSLRSSRTLATAPAIATRAQLELRLHAILATGRNRQPVTRRGLLTGVVFAALAVFPIAMIVPWAAAAEGGGLKGAVELPAIPGTGDGRTVGTPPSVGLEKRGPSILVRTLDEKTGRDAQMRELIAQLADRDSAIREKASEALVSAGHRAIQAIVATDFGRDRESALRAMYVLATMISKEHPMSYVPDIAEDGPRPVLHIMHQMIKPGEEPPPSEIEGLIAELSSPDFDKRQEATEALIAAGYGAVDELVATVSETRGLAKDRRAAMRALYILSMISRTPPHLRGDVGLFAARMSRYANRGSRPPWHDVLLEGGPRGDPLPPAAATEWLRRMPVDPPPRDAVSDLALSAMRLILLRDAAVPDKEIGSLIEAERHRFDSLMAAERHRFACESLKALDAKVTEENGSIHVSIAERQYSSFDPRWRGANEGLAHLRQVCGLTRLEIQRSESISEAGLNHLAALGDLEELRISSTPFTTDRLLHLKTLTRLRRLKLDSCEGLTDACLAYVGQWPQLETLEYDGLTLRKEGIEYIANNPDLQRLLLAERPEIPSGGFDPLAGYPNLRRIGVWSTPPSNEAAARMGKLIELRLSFLGREYDDDFLEKLGALPQLTRLSLIQVQISDEGLCRLSHLKKLRHLTINCSPCTGKGLEAIAELPELRILNYWNCSHGKVGDEHLPHLQKLTKLEGVAFICPEITDEGLDHFRKMKSMKYICLTNADRISDEAITHLQRDMPDCDIRCSRSR